MLCRKVLTGVGEMAKFAVSSDSTCDLKKEYRERRDIWFVPLTFTMEKNGKSGGWLVSSYRKIEL